MRRKWVGVDLNSALHGGLPKISVLSARPATAEITHRFGLVTSQRVPPGGALGNAILQVLARMRLVPYARRTEVARIPVTATEARTERVRVLLSTSLVIAGVLVLVVRPELPVVLVSVVLIGLAMLLRPRVRVRVSSKDALKGRARLLAHPDYIENLPQAMRRTLIARNGRVTG